MNQDFATRCRTAQECIPKGTPFRDRLTALHNAMLVRIAELEAENKRLRLDTETFNNENWARHDYRGGMRGKLETLDQIADALTHDGLTADDLRRIMAALVVIVARMQEAVTALDEWQTGVVAMVEYP